ncbi:MAG: phenylacetate-CoA oxygenase subunit PaaC [Bdellovibrionales bacterium]|nr:phenylacetate-CoA oxygenase subunit PaaC [Bdellovibrionales bacterium]
MEASAIQKAISDLPKDCRTPLTALLLRLGDDRLILGHRLSEWCGHAPILEEDIALANIALDHIGQSEALLRLAGLVEGNGRSEDDLAFLRDAKDFRCCRMVQLPKGDFAFTILRQFLFSTYSACVWEQMQKSPWLPFAGIAQKSLKEAMYHVRHSQEWTLRLGDGIEESHNRAQEALSSLWPYTAELFRESEGTAELQKAGIACSLSAVIASWRERVEALLKEATLTIPEDDTALFLSNIPTAQHTEHLGHLLAEMQVLPRAHPGAQW